MNKKTKNKTFAGYSMIIVGITALICIALFVFLGYQFVLKPNIEFEAEQTQSITSTESDKISIPGFESWTIDANKTKASASFYNPENNSCYFVISVVLDDTGEKIYESKYLKPGQHLYEVELTKPLKAGKYKAILHYSTYSTTDLSPMNGADVPFELTVK